MKLKARGLAQHDGPPQHGGPPGWLEESDPVGCDFVRDGRSIAACPDGPHHLPRSGADMLLNVHKALSRAIRHARKAWPDTLVDPCLLSGAIKAKNTTLYALECLGSSPCLLVRDLPRGESVIIIGFGGMLPLFLFILSFFTLRGC